MSINTTRKQPAHREGEQNCLGLCLKNREALSEITGILTPDDFYWEEHRVIYAVIYFLHSQGKHVDPVTVGDELTKRREIEVVGGQAVLNLLFDTALEAKEAGNYAIEVKKWASLRELAQVSENAVAQIHSGDVSDATSLIASLNSSLVRITEGMFKGDMITPADIYTESSSRYTEARDNPGNQGISSGFVALDRMTGGFQAGEYVAVGGRTNIGKTAFVLQLCYNIAKRTKQPVIIFSMEMSKEKLMDRLVAMEAGVDALDLRNGRLNDMEFQRVRDALIQLRQIPIIIDDTPGQSVSEMKAKALKTINKYGSLAFVAIDYLDFINPSCFRQDGHAQLADISKDLKNMAKLLPCTTCLLVQLNRNADSRKDKTPIMTDVGGTDRVARDVDALMLLYDPSYYENKRGACEPAVNDARSPYATRMTALKTREKPVELILEKQRNGPKGVIDLVFAPQTNTFKEREERFYDDN